MAEIRSPSDLVLATAVRAALASVELESSVRSIRREANVYESSHHSEVLACTLENGLELTLLCKYGDSHNHDRAGLRRGLGYEANVYRYVLADEYPTPRFYGSYADPLTGLTWLCLEYLGEGWQLDLGPETAVVDAARMIGDLHRRAADDTDAPSLSVLYRHDRRYFRAHLQQARSLADRWGERVPAFSHLVDRFGRELDVLVSAPKTVVHGEFTPHNVVWADERPHAVDWEEAAIGAGEIDLACLTDEWEEELVEQATSAYLRSRWPAGPPHDFLRALHAARLYWLVRWLGDPEEAGTEEAGTEEGIRWIADRANELAGPGGPDVPVRLGTDAS